MKVLISGMEVQLMVGDCVRSEAASHMGFMDCIITKVEQDQIWVERPHAKISVHAGVPSAIYVATERFIILRYQWDRERYKLLERGFTF